jgi:hypothetical protein
VDAAALRANMVAGRFPVSDQGALDERCCSVRQSRVVLASVADVKSAEAREPNRASQSLNPLATVTKTNSSPGRARNKPLKPLRREGRIASANLW